MKIHTTALKDVLLIESHCHKDNRGFFIETWNKGVFDAAIGREIDFYQDNQSNSKQGVLRGLHYQLKRPQGKLVRVTSGDVLDIVVDLRQMSPTFGQHLLIELSGKKLQQLWIPEGFAHGFFVLSKTCEFHYKTTDYYDKSDEHCIKWDDPLLGINWSKYSNIMPIVSPKDQLGVSFEKARKFL